MDIFKKAFGSKKSKPKEDSTTKPTDKSPTPSSKVPAVVEKEIIRFPNATLIASDEPFYLNSIPRDIWLQIISYFTVPDLLKCACISKYFYNFTSTDSIWQDYICDTLSNKKSRFVNEPFLILEITPHKVRDSIQLHGPVFIGMKEVGKTSLVRRFLSHDFTSEYVHTNTYGEFNTEPDATHQKEWNKLGSKGEVITMYHKPGNEIRNNIQVKTNFEQGPVTLFVTDTPDLLDSNSYGHPYVREGWYARGNEALLFYVYDITDSKSWEDLEGNCEYFPMLNKVTLVIIGNKLDKKKSERKVDLQRVQKFVKEKKLSIF